MKSGRESIPSGLSTGCPYDAFAAAAISLKDYDLIL